MTEQLSGQSFYAHVNKFRRNKLEIAFNLDTLGTAHQASLGHVRLFFRFGWLTVKGVAGAG